VPHLALRDRDQDGRHGTPALEDDDGGFSIERALLELNRRADRLAADDLQQRRDLSPADDGAVAELSAMLLLKYQTTEAPRA
jgi:hypothetical protein